MYYETRYLNALLTSHLFWKLHLWEEDNAKTLGLLQMRFELKYIHQDSKARAYNILLIRVASRASFSKRSCWILRPRRTTSRNVSLHMVRLVILTNNNLPPRENHSQPCWAIISYTKWVSFLTQCTIQNANRSTGRITSTTRSLRYHWERSS